MVIKNSSSPILLFQCVQNVRICLTFCTHRFVNRRLNQKSDDLRNTPIPKNDHSSVTKMFSNTLKQSAQKFSLTTKFFGQSSISLASNWVMLHNGVYGEQKPPLDSPVGKTWDNVDNLGGLKPFSINGKGSTRLPLVWFGLPVLSTVRVR